MSETPRWKLAVLAVTSIVFVGALGRRCLDLFPAEVHQETMTPRAERTAATPTVKTPTKTKPRLTLADAQQHDPFAYPVWLRPPKLEVAESAPTNDNPAAKPAPKREAKEVLVVSAVFLNETDRCAIVGDRIVRIGDVIRGFRIADIHKDGVEVMPVSD